MASTPQEIQIGDLPTELIGELIAPDALGYDEARADVMEGVNRYPLAVVRVAHAGDVVRVVSFAREAGLELAVRSGGHSFAGHGTSNGGIVIDLSGMKGLELDEDRRTAWVETGITAASTGHDEGQRGLATGLGDTGSVGIGGITLAGGIGFLARRNGLTIDGLLAADVVTADGGARSGE